MDLNVKKRASSAWNTLGDAANKVGHGVWWGGYAFGRLVTATVAAVPFAAVVAEGANAISRIKSGTDIAATYIDSMHSAVDPWLESPSALTQTAGLVGRVCLASAEVAGTVATWGGDVVGVIASHSGSNENWVDKAGRAAVDIGVGAAALYPVAKVFQKDLLPHPPRP